MARQSHEVEEELEGAAFGGGRLHQAGISKSSQLPVLQVVGPPRVNLEVIVDPLMLEEERLVSPQGQDCRRSGHNSPNEVATSA